METVLEKLPITNDDVSWKLPIYKADAQKAYEEISQLEQITAENIVDLARDENSVLHNDFEWNDEIAGQKYRLMQAQQMVRMFVFTPRKEEHSPTRVFQISNAPRVYKPIVFFTKNEDEYQSLLKRAKAELQAFKQRYKSLTELDKIFEEIDYIL
jgi:hypothetical protein